MPRSKLRSPSMFRSSGDGVRPSTCDSHFSLVEGKINRLKIDLSNACQGCIWFTARLLLRGVQMFDTEHNPDLRHLKLEINRAIEVKDTTILERCLRAFLAPVDRTTLNFREPDAETILFIALDDMHSALENLMGEEYSEAVSNTVRCRAQLRHFDIGD